MSPSWAVVQRDRILSHSALSFLRDKTEQLIEHFTAILDAGVASGDIRRVDGEVECFVRRLAWDSEHFGTPIYKLELVRWQGRRTGHALVERLAGSLAQASAALSSETGEAYYLFAEVPAQDADVAQALGLAGWRLVETRLTYYSSPLPAIDAPRSPVRWANEADVSHLREVASSAANPYDRYHADPFFGPDVASRYLATYVEQSVRGFASGVLVPAPGDGRPAGAFFTALVHHRGACPLGVPHECDLDLGLGRIPLVAVSDDRKGWHARLLAEMLRYFAKEELDVVLMTTQLANRPVIRNCEKLGLRLGSAAHVFATHPRAHRLGQA